MTCLQLFCTSFLESGLGLQDALLFLLGLHLADLGQDDLRSTLLAPFRRLRWNLLCIACGTYLAENCALVQLAPALLL